MPASAAAAGRVVLAAAATSSSTRLRRRLWMLGAAAIACTLVFFTRPQPLHSIEPAEPSTLAGHAREQRALEVRRRFDQAVLMLHARRYEEAVVALERVRTLAPNLPEAHVNLGFAWLGLKRSQAAQAAFQRAIDMRPQQANAYYGLAMALEQRGDLPAALGAMRSYLHLSRADDAHRARARAALWEWEERLGRHRLKGAPSPGAAPR